MAWDDLNNDGKPEIIGEEISDSGRDRKGRMRSNASYQPKLDAMKCFFQRYLHTGQAAIGLHSNPINGMVKRNCSSRKSGTYIYEQRKDTKKKNSN